MARHGALRARLEKNSAGMADKARGGKFLLVPPYCKKFSAMAAEKYCFQLVYLLRDNISKAQPG